MSKTCNIVLEGNGVGYCRTCGERWDAWGGEESPCEVNSIGIWPSVIFAALAGLSVGLLVVAMAMVGPLAALVRHTLAIGG